MNKDIPLYLLGILAGGIVGAIAGWKLGGLIVDEIEWAEATKPLEVIETEDVEESEEPEDMVIKAVEEKDMLPYDKFAKPSLEDFVKKYEKAANESIEPMEIPSIRIVTADEASESGWDVEELTFYTKDKTWADSFEAGLSDSEVKGKLGALNPKDLFGENLEQKGRIYVLNENEEMIYELSIVWAAFHPEPRRKRVKKNGNVSTTNEE